jgi:methylaspartate ammonia-lyase
MSARRIVGILTVPGRGGFFADDQLAIRAGATRDGFRYAGDPVTAGFASIRQPGEALSVLLVLDDGQVATGDCASVQYSGAAGRDPVFTAAEAAAAISAHVTPLLAGQPLCGFRALTAFVDATEVAGSPLHTAVRYGLSQALLDAVARSQGVTMAEVVRDEYDTGLPIAPVPMFVQSGDERYESVDRMILKEAGALPHGLINSVDGKLGARGELLAGYLRWVRDRVLKLRRRPDYHPTLHVDTYGTIGLIFGGDTRRIGAYLAELGELVAPFPLRVEHPVDAGSRDGQVSALAALRDELRRRESSVQLVADEWCNTLADIEKFVAAQAADVIHVKTPDLGGLNHTAEALLLVRRSGLAAYCGGTCNETDRSAQVSAHVAMACGAAQVLAKPGMGVDEGMMIVGNEMARAAALAGSREAAGNSAAAGSPDGRTGTRPPDGQAGAAAGAAS